MAEEGSGEDIRRRRIEKLERIEAVTGKRYPNDFEVDATAADVHEAAGDKDAARLESGKIEVSVAGRVMGRNSFGKSTFLRLKDRSGTVQVYARKDVLGEDAYSLVKLTDVGDIVGVRGTVFRTRTGEVTVAADTYRILTKGLRPLPEKWHGLKDRELRYRMRYVDLIVNDRTREVFRTRAAMIRYIRSFLDSHDFMEVETPMMHTVLGGANARPFVTHHNALDMDLYLRIAPELYLKRLVVGGLDRVYEINRNFRNEGLSTLHNPEFTMLEFYWAYATFTDLMDLTENMLQGLVRELTGGTTVEYGGVKIDFSGPFRRLSVWEALENECGIARSTFDDMASAREAALRNGVDGDEVDAIATKHGAGRGDEDRDRNAALELGMRIFEERIEKTLVQPTFLTDFPLAVSPLARRNDTDPFLVDRFELYVCGSEIANAFSELNDPLDQEERFKRQLEAKAAGDSEAMEYDEDYIRALEYGLPPTAGEGIGIDRLTMVLTDSKSIRDVILFPLMRPENR